jgi:hypothetical protein
MLHLAGDTGGRWDLALDAGLRDVQPANLKHCQLMDLVIIKSYKDEALLSMRNLCQITRLSVGHRHCAFAQHGCAMFHSETWRNLAANNE